MRAVTRVTILLGKLSLAAALALAPSLAAAQEAPPTTNNTATPDTVGPRELQNFKLPGTVTRPADQPATTAAPPPQRAPAADAPAPSPRQPSADRPPTTPAEPRRQAERAAPSPTNSVERSAITAPTPSVPPATAESLPSTAPTAPVSFPPAAEPAPAASDGPNVPLYVWLIAALVLGAGGAFLFRRNRAREAFAGGPQIDEFAGPEIEPPITRAPPLEPAPAPALPQPPSPPAPAGIVSTRLRPWLEVEFAPARCVLDDERATIEFVVELFNSGSAPARNVIVDVTAFNAGPTQDTLINGFFGRSNEQGQRIEVIPPLQRAALELQLSIPREQLQPYELAGKQVFVPILACNATYRWSTGDGQTSASYLVGRGTQNDKLAPFRIDAGPRIFRGLAAKVLPTGIRR